MEAKSKSEQRGREGNKERDENKGEGHPHQRDRHQQHQQPQQQVYSEDAAGMAALAELVKRHGACGVTISYAEDSIAVAVKEPIYTVEAGPGHKSAPTLAAAILDAAGWSPTKTCRRCGKEKHLLSDFSRKADRPDGRYYYCNDCNRKLTPSGSTIRKRRAERVAAQQGEGGAGVLAA